MAELYLIKAKPNCTLIWEGKVYQYGNEYEFKVGTEDLKFFKAQTTIISANIYKSTATKSSVSMESNNGLENKDNRKNTKAST